MDVQNLEAFTIKGFRSRARNALAMKPATDKILNRVA